MKIASIIINGRTCHPIYGDGISFVTKMEDGERYYRTTIDSDFTFTDGAGDYSWIVSQPFDTEFKVTVTLEDGEVWHGVFWKTDCEFDGNARNVKVKFQTDDIYRKLLDHISDEVDLVKLAPEIQSIKMTKRPILQIVTTADNQISDTLTNILGNMSWDQSIIDTGVDMDNHAHDYHFGNEALDNRTLVYRVKFEEPYPQYAYLNGVYQGYIPPLAQMDFGVKHRFTRTDGLYYIEYWVENANNIRYAYIYDASDDSVIVGTSQFNDHGTFYNNWLLHDLQFIRNDWDTYSAFGTFYKSYARYIFDDKFEGYSRIPSSDLVEQNLNYRYCMPYTDASIVIFSSDTQEDPTEWGRDQDGRYFINPSSALVGQFFPIGKSSWSPSSCWARSPFESAVAEDMWKVQYTLKDAYPLYSAISVILHELVPDAHYGVTIHHEGTSDYCPLYSPRNPFAIMVSPMSNVKKTYYQNPAQTGKTTLRKILDMMRDCFNCYWAILPDGKFVIRHISYFTQMGSTAVDLTAIAVPRNWKKWDFGQSKWKYAKQELPEKVNFSYAEKQTAPFNAMPLEYVSGYVQKGETEELVIDGFCADVDYIVSMMGSVSDDGYVLLLPYNPTVSPDNPNFSRTTLDITPVMQFGGIEADGATATFYLDMDRSPISAGSLSLSFYGADPNTALETVVVDSAAGGKQSFSLTHVIPAGTLTAKFQFTLDSGASATIGVVVTRCLAQVHAPVMPIIDGILIDGYTARVQNGWATRYYLFNEYGRYDMSAEEYIFNGEEDVAISVKRARQQTVTFPYGSLSVGTGSMHTTLGDGEINSISWNPLQESAEAELRLDMEYRDPEEE